MGSPDLSDADQRRLDECLARLREEVDAAIGYPVSAAFDYTPLLPFLRYPINNIGDPFAGGGRLNTHEFEREVVAAFARLAHAEPGDVWGYVTGGGTEGNLYGLFLARELLPEGVVYFSEDTHYSVPKLLRLLRAPGAVVRSRPDGAVDLDDLRDKLKARRGAPAIIFANVGTTMKGAVDDLSGIAALLEDLKIARRYVHADAALSGMILPFVEDAPPWDFRAGVDSLAVSGHKMIGSPIPCGVVLARRTHVGRIARPVEYVGAADATIPGSRDGVTPLFLWYAFRTAGVAGLRRVVCACLETAAYAVERLRAAGLNPWRHAHSVTVVFERPREELVRKWHLAASRDIAHLVAMPQVTRERIDRFASEIIGRE